MSIWQRFLMSPRENSDDKPGLVMHDDGTVWVVDAAGAETQLPGAANGGSQPALHGCFVYLNNGGKLVPGGNNSIPWDLVAYDTDGYAVDGAVVIPAGLGGIYLVEAVVYLDTNSGLNPGLDRPLALIDEPSNSCDIQFDRKNPDSNAPFDPGWWYGSGSFVRPFGEGDSIDLLINAGTDTDTPANNMTQINGGTGQTMMSVTRLYDLPVGFVNPWA